MIQQAIARSQVDSHLRPPSPMRAQNPTLETRSGRAAGPSGGTARSQNPVLENSSWKAAGPPGRPPPMRSEDGSWNTAKPPGGLTPIAARAETLHGVPRLQLEKSGAMEPLPLSGLSAPGRSDALLGRECESEIDRLVRERLEGGHTARTHTGTRIKDISEYHDTWQGRFEGATRETCWSLYESVLRGSNRLLGHGSTCTCKRIVKAVPIIVLEDSEPENYFDGSGAPPPEYSRNSDCDLPEPMLGPAAAQWSTAYQTTTVPNYQPVGLRADTAKKHPASSSSSDAYRSTPPERNTPSDRHSPQDDTRSCLAPSVAMRSSAAAALGSLKVGGGSVTTTGGKGHSPHDAKSVLPQLSGMTSAAAAALGPLGPGHRINNGAHIAAGIGASTLSPAEGGAAPKRPRSDEASAVQ